MDFSVGLLVVVVTEVCVLPLKHRQSFRTWLTAHSFEPPARPSVVLQLRDFVSRIQLSLLAIHTVSYRPTTKIRAVRMCPEVEGGCSFLCGISRRFFVQGLLKGQSHFRGFGNLYCNYSASCLKY